MCESSVRHWAGNTLTRQTKSPPPGNWSLGTTVFPSKDLMLINIDCWSPLPSFHQNLCPTHCFFFFYEKQSSTSLHEWRSCWEIFPIECAPGKTWQHTQCTLPSSLGAPATPRDLPRSLPNWQRRALQWHLLLKNQYSEKHKSSRTVETISSCSSFLPFHRSQIFWKSVAPFNFLSQKDMHVPQHIIFPLFSGALWIHHMTDFLAFQGLHIKNSYSL